MEGKGNVRLRKSGVALAGGMLLLCSCAEAQPQSVAIPAESSPAWATVQGPSDLEIESEQLARENLEAQRRAAEEARREAAAAAAAAAAEAAAQAAAEAAAAEAAAQAAAEAAAAEAAAEVGGEECIGYGCSPEQDAQINDLERRCSDGTATVEECFGPGSDQNGNGVADINE